MAVIQIPTLVTFVTTSVNAVGDLNADLAAIRNQFNSLVTASNTLISGLTIPSPTISGTLTTTATLAGDLLFTDALYDIGKTGATRPRDIFTSRNATIGGTLSVSGNVISDLLFTDALYDIGKTGATRPRDGFFSRNLVATGKIAAGGAVATTGLTTQVADGSLGVSWINAAGTTQWGTYLVGGVDLMFYDFANGRNALRLNLGASGSAAFSHALTVGNNLTLSNATAQIIPGATSLSLRNNANSADNLIITDAGLATFRNTVTITTGGLTVSAGTSALQAITGTTLTSTGNTNLATLGTLRFFSAAAGVGIQTISGSRGANAALADLLTKLAAYNLIVDTTT